MKKEVKGFACGMLFCSILGGGIAIAKEAMEVADIYYKNINIYVDGTNVTPTDGNGNPVEPFIYSGTTYLPVRAVANAFGQDVEWDGETSSIYIGKKDQTKPDNYLERIQYNDFKVAEDYTRLHIINGKIKDYSGTEYKSGLLFDSVSTYSDATIEDDGDKSHAMIAYPLNSQYSNLKGNIVLPKSCELTTGNIDYTGNDNDSADIFFYGDGKLLYKATAVTASMPFKFDIKVSGVNQLQIKIRAAENSGPTYIALTDLALFK